MVPVKNLPQFLHRFLEPVLAPVLEPILAPVLEPVLAPVLEPVLAPVLEPSFVQFSVFIKSLLFFLGIPNVCRYLLIFLDFLGLFSQFF